MNNKKSTPRPWSIDGYNVTSIIAEFHGKPRNWQYICDCNYGKYVALESLELNRANAKLIVMAVNCHDELVEMLKECAIICAELGGQADNINQKAMLLAQLERIEKVLNKTDN